MHSYVVCWFNFFIPVTYYVAVFGVPILTITYWLSVKQCKRSILVTLVVLLAKFFFMTCLLPRRRKRAKKFNYQLRKVIPQNV